MDMKNIIGDKINEKYNIKTLFYHISSKKHLYSLLKGIDMNKVKDNEWNQGKGVYFFKSEKWAEKQEGVGNTYVDIMIELETTLNFKNFEIDYEFSYVLPDITKKYIPNLRKIFKYNFILNKNNKYYLIFSNTNNKNEFYLKDEKFRDDFITLVKNKNNDEFCYLPIDKKGNIKFEQNIYGAMVVKDCMKLLNNVGIYNLITKDVFNSTDDEKIALRYIGPIIKPKRYKLKENGVWGEWVDNNVNETYVNNIYSLDNKYIL